MRYRLSSFRGIERWESKPQRSGIGFIGALMMNRFLSETIAREMGVKTPRKWNIFPSLGEFRIVSALMRGPKR